MADTGWVLSGTQANVDRSSGTDWNDPTDAATSNDDWAWCPVAKFYDTSDWLRLTNFDFSSIPDSASIDGIEVRIERKASAADYITDTDVQLVLDGVVKGDDKASASYWPTSDANADYGGAADTWNSGLTIANIKDSGFGMQIATINNNEDSAVTAYVDCVWIKIYYTEATFVPRIVGIV